MPVLQTLDLVVLLSLLIIAVGLVPASRFLLNTYLGIRSRRLVDATDWAPAPPPAVSTLESRLAASGFRRMGVRAALLAANQRRFQWNLVGQPSTTYVSLTPAPTLAGGVLMACHTAFADGAFVATFYPTGVDLHSDHLFVESCGESPEAAIALHLRGVADFMARHGVPLQNRSMADLLERDATYRQLHGGQTLRPKVYAYVGLAAVIAMACGVTVARLIVLDH